MLNYPDLYYNFSTEHKQMLSDLHTMVSQGYLAIRKEHDKLLTSYQSKKPTSFSILTIRV
jgi:hypothetical protein